MKITLPGTHTNEHIINSVKNLSKDNSISLMEAAILFSELYDLDADYIGVILAKNQEMKRLIMNEAITLNYLKKE